MATRPRPHALATGASAVAAAACLLLLALLVAPAPCLADPPATACRPEIDPGQPQYIVGYGSLMQTESRLRTAPSAGRARPVRVSGLARGWYVRGSATSPATFLGAVESAGAHMNAALYPLPVVADLAATDARESGYCRTTLPAERLEMLDGGEKPRGQLWLYAVPPGRATTPEAGFPIVQSYVDVFLSGCLEIGEAYALEGFAAECVHTTQGWSRHWVNDRVFPRRPFVHQPRAGAIDATLRQAVPDLLEARVIE